MIQCTQQQVSNKIRYFEPTWICQEEIHIYVGRVNPCGQTIDSIQSK